MAFVFETPVLEALVVELGVVEVAEVCFEVVASSCPERTPLILSRRPIIAELSEYV
jgi:hypothetical protein